MGVGAGGVGLSGREVCCSAAESGYFFRQLLLLLLSKSFWIIG